MAVNKKKRKGRPPSDQGKLSKEKIVHCARKQLTENGKIPSIRMVAMELETDAMALYYYFSCKADLLEAISISLVKEIYEPIVTDDWESELVTLCHSYLQLLERHPGLLESMLSISVEGPAQVFADRLSTALSPLQLDDASLHNSLALLGDYLHGFALALNCDTNGKLTIEMSKDPLNLYMRAVKTLAK